MGKPTIVEVNSGFDTPLRGVYYTIDNDLTGNVSYGAEK
jgi:hypothetical protein